MAEMRGMLILQTEIEKAKDKLKDVNENIKKLTGRDPTDLRPVSARGRLRDARGRGGTAGRLFNLARRGILPEESGGHGPSPAKRGRPGGAFSRLGPMPARRREDSGEEDELPNKLSLHSSVVAARDARSREDTMAQQSRDREGLQRNRRMFGLLLGTLQKFKTESKKDDQKAVQRKQIEKKLDEQADREKKKYQEETQQLIEVSQLEQAKITRLQQKMELVNEHEAVTSEMQKLHNFLCTQARPRIFWRPKTMNPATEARMKDSKKIVDKMIKEKDLALDREISKVMEIEHQREERIRSRLRLDKENADGELEDNRGPSSALEKSAGKERRMRKAHHEKREKLTTHGQPREAKKRQHEMQYDDGEEEEMEEGDHLATAGGEGMGGCIIKKEREEGEGGRKEKESEVEKKEGQKEKDGKGKASSKVQQLDDDDGNNTDVDYEDDAQDEEEEEVVEEEEKEEEEEEGGEEEQEEEKEEREENEEKRTVVSSDILSSIPMPPEPPQGEAEPMESQQASGEREGVAVRLLRLAQVGGEEEEGEEERERREARRRRAMMAEDQEDVADEPADE